jgi:hypothetical protein
MASPSRRGDAYCKFEFKVLHISNSVGPTDRAIQFIDQLTALDRYASLFQYPPTQRALARLVPGTLFFKYLKKETIALPCTFQLDKAKIPPISPTIPVMLRYM